MSELNDKLKGNWNVIKGKMKQQYAELTDDDLESTPVQPQKISGTRSPKGYFPFSGTRSLKISGSRSLKFSGTRTLKAYFSFSGTRSPKFSGSRSPKISGTRSLKTFPFSGTRSPKISPKISGTRSENFSINFRD